MGWWGVGFGGWGVGDWALGIGPPPQPPIPYPQSPIPNPQFNILIIIIFIKNNLNFFGQYKITSHPFSFY